MNDQIENAELAHTAPTIEPEDLPVKKQKIKNKLYRQFLDTGMIQLISEDQLHQALENVKGRRGQYIAEARSLLIMLYLTGCRPYEALQLKGMDIKKDGMYILIEVPGSKGGLPRTVFLKFQNALAKELYNFAQGLPDDMILFYHYKGSYQRRVIAKNGAIKNRIETTDSLRYHFKKWSNGVLEDPISPYFLRHSRFSQIVQAGATFEDVKMLKGSRSMESVTPYIHMSSRTARKLAKIIK